MIPVFEPGSLVRATDFLPRDRMNFGQALEALKQGARVARTGWNGKGMWLSLSGPIGGREIPFGQFWSVNNRDYAAGQDNGCAKVLPCITMKTADGSILMGWLASQSDMLSDDWCVVEDDAPKPEATPWAAPEVKPALEIKPGWHAYQSEKRVQAAPITNVGGEEPDGSRRIWVEGYSIQQPRPFFARGVPAIGDMLVEYRDGYMSWSPRQAFLDGYRNAE